MLRRKKIQFFENRIQSSVFEKNRNKIVNKIRLKYSDSKIFLMRFKMNYLELVDIFLL